MAMSVETVDDLILPEHYKKWTTIKEKWFVLDPKCPYQAREPGLLKVEQESCPGISFIGEVKKKSRIQYNYIKNIFSKYVQFFLYKFYQIEIFLTFI